MIENSKLPWPVLLFTLFLIFFATMGMASAEDGGIGTYNSNTINESLNTNNTTSGLSDSPNPTYQGNNNNTGQSNYNGPQKNNTAWNYVTCGDYVTMSDADSVSNVEPIGGVTGSIVIDRNGTIYVPTTYALYAFNKDKTLKWIIKFNAIYGASYISTPAIGNDGIIYFLSFDHRLYAVNPNGTVKWTYIINSTSSSKYYDSTPVGSPRIGSDGTIYFVNIAGDLSAVDPEGNLKWTCKIGAMSEIPVTSAIGSDGTIYLGSTDGKIYAVSSNGNIKWTYTTNNTQFSSPSIGSDGTIYIGSNYGILYALNPDGTLKWDYTAEGCIQAISISKNDIIYLGCGNAKLYALNSNGSVLWAYQTNITISEPYNWVNGLNSRLSGSVIGNDSTIYFGSADGNVYALNENGTVKWTYKITSSLQGELPVVSSTPAIDSDGSLYFGVRTDWNGGGMTYAISDNVVPGKVTNLRTGKIFSSIQKAIDDVDTRDGDSLKVTEGTYLENVLVNKKLNILAYGSATVFAFNNSTPVFTIVKSGSGTNITGFNISGGWSGVSMISAQNCSINYNKILNYTNYRIYLNNSNPSSIIYGWTVLPTIKASISGGVYNSTQYVKLITTNAKDCRIYYTTDGSDPSTNSENYFDFFGEHISQTNPSANNSPRYSGTIVISKNTTLKFMVWSPFYTLSPIYIENYVIDSTAPSVVSNLPSGYYNTNKNVVLKMNENGTIYYSTDGSNPTKFSQKYSSPIVISSKTTLKFIGIDEAGNLSPVYTQTYNIDKTSPKIVSSNPKNLAIGVSRTSTIAIKFSENIKGSINWSKIVVKNKYGKVVKISKWISGNTLYIKNSIKRSKYSYYTVYIPAAAIKDSVGNNLYSSCKIKFKTGK